MITNAMTVDVEDYFQVSAFAQRIDRADWSGMPCRVERNTERVLEIFSNADVSGTFFTLGWVAERFPNLIRRIVDGGHELASHGFSHYRIHEQSPEEFREDVTRTKRLLEDVGGQEVAGYRAASFSLSEKTLWATEILANVGYRYSSSVYPIHHDHYGMPKAPRFSFRHQSPGALLELPITTINIVGQNLPCGGGGYFRLFPYGLFYWALKRVNHRDRQPCIFYFHPWEIDHEQPRLSDLPFKTRFRHYTNLDRMEHRLRRLLDDFSWGRLDRINGQQMPAAA